MTCDRCFQPLSEGEHGLDLCPLEPRRFAPVLWKDSIEGGIEIAHGLCNDDGTPRRFDSRSEIKQAAKEKGLIQWGEAHTEDSLKEAREYIDWRRSGEAQKQKAEREEMRRAGIRPQFQPAPMRSSSPEQRERIRQIVRERLAR